MNGGPSHDLAVSLDWEYDWDFVRLLAEEARGRGLRTRTVLPWEVSELAAEFRAGRFDFRVLLDRASPSGPDFVTLQASALERGKDVIDPLEKLRWASDKATMHLEFIAHGIHTPYTVILPSCESERQPSLGAGELAPLGSPFVVKPANTTGGSLGVVEDARTIEDALAARRTYPGDKYLLQEKIYPEDRDGRRFWFRGFFILGQVHCAWWDDRTHVYAELTDDETERFGLQALGDVVRRVAAVSGLRFFSTEIVRDVRGRLVSVDYVNENCDMRLRSKHPDGVPDALVGKVASRIAAYVAEGAAPWAGPGRSPS
jgi:hypothetical protein